MRSLLLVLPLAAAGCLLPRPAHAQVVAGPLDTAEVRRWQEDLAFLAAELPARHANLFHTMRRAQFDSALAALRQRLPSLGVTR